jgi:nucleoid-associated protein YgaU
MGLLDNLKNALSRSARSSGKASAAPAKPKADFSDVKGGASSTAAPPPAAERYTVVAGDSLSKIAQHAYGNANEWRRIYDANRQLIGDNPDLIKPGQKLTIPPKA